MGKGNPVLQWTMTILGIIYSAGNPRHRAVWGWTAFGAAGVFVETWLAVHISKVQRDFVNAMSDKDEESFWHSIQAYLYVVSCAAVVYSVSSYGKDQLVLLWRASLTARCFESYFANRAFYRIGLGETVDNPGQRIIDDAKALCEEIVSTALTISLKVLKVTSFAWVLWGISPWLLYFAILYCSLATFLAVAMFSKELKRLSDLSCEKEASLRSVLVRVHHCREEVAFYNSSHLEHSSIVALFDDLLVVDRANSWLTAVVEAFRRAFSYLTLVLPYIATAASYFAGEVTYGEVSQTGNAFYYIQSGLGVLVARLQRLSKVVSHINRFGEAFDAMQTADKDPPEAIELVCGAGPTSYLLDFDGVVIRTPDGKRLLCNSLSFTLGAGDSVLIVGPSGCGKSSILRAAAGLFRNGSGSIRRPSIAQWGFFLPQKSYMFWRGGLRVQLQYPTAEGDTSDSNLVYLLHKVGLGGLPARVGGWDTPCDFASILSPGEQQRIGFVRLLHQRPRVAFLDEATSAVDEASERELYTLLANTVGAYISIGHRSTLLKYHRYVLAPLDQTEWRLYPRDDWVKLHKR